MYEHAAALAAAGDLAGARALHAAIGAMLGTDTPRAALAVPDLNEERAKRRGR